MTAPDIDTLWLRHAAGHADRGVRVICFPHAGGSAGFFRPLAAALAPEHAIYAVQLPGRQDRYREPPIESIAELAEAVLPAVSAAADRPIALFGHSMGAILAFEVALRLERLRTAPRAVFVSGRRAPSRHRVEVTHLLPDPELIREIAALGGPSVRVLEDPETAAEFIPVIRSDHRAIETYRYQGKTPLSCPIHVLAGARDSRVDTEDLEAWRIHTTGRYDLSLFDGGHFYLTACTTAVASAVCSTLSPR